MDVIAAAVSRRNELVLGFKSFLCSLPCRSGYLQGVASPRLKNTSLTKQMAPVVDFTATTGVVGLRKVFVS
jgi:hypothetical protein